MDDFYKEKDFHIIGSRCCGKTSSLIFNASYRNIPYILTCKNSVKYGNMLAEDLGYKNIKFIPYEEINNIKTNFLIDDVDKFLHNQYNGFRGFSMSTKEY